MKVTLLTGLLLSPLTALASNSVPVAKPNILFIAVDDLRCELGCYGVKEIQSPNFDRLAKSGVAFTRAYCQQAVCNPSRVSLMTGLRPDSTKVWDLATDFRATTPDAVTIPQHFRQHGYRAVAFGKIFHNTFPDDVSWDEPTRYVKGVIGYSKENQKRLAEFKMQMQADGKKAPAVERTRGPATEVQEQPDEMNFDGRQTTEALVKLRELATGKSPFFLAVGYIRPHLPFITPRKYWDLYDRARIPLAGNPFLPHGAPAVAFGDKSFGGFYELRDYMDYSDAPSPFERTLTEAQQRELKHGYYASVSFIDAQVGRLLDELERLDLAQNIVVVLWGDHGWKLGEHGGWCKQTNYEIDTRAPLMIRAPHAKANGQQSHALVEFVDIYPTLCELALLPVPKALEGKSLAPLLIDASAKVKDAAFSQFPRKHEGRDYMGYAMRTERYRYVEWLEQDSGRIAERELYDHESDPEENENIARRPEHAALLEKLSAQLWRTLPKPQMKSPQMGAAVPAPDRSKFIEDQR
jgi:iduronate 2-sulfatase